MDFSTIEIHLASAYDLEKVNAEVVESVQNFLEDKFMTQNIACEVKIKYSCAEKERK